MSDEQKYTIQGLDVDQRSKCKIERWTASKVQKLHFRRGGGASHDARRS